MIPGQNNDQLLSEGFEQDLFNLLAEEHERVDLFCKSKIGEVHRRLRHLSNLVQKLSERIAPLRPNNRRLQKLSKLEEAILRVGNDIQALSSFISAQKAAFRKLTKKYQKWTGSSKLNDHFQKVVLNLSEYVGSQGDPVAPLLSQYTTLLEAVRVPFDSAATQRAQYNRPPSASLNGEMANQDASANALNLAYDSGADVDADAAFFTVPVGRNGGRAAYWIHYDNLVQARVLIQSFARVTGTSRRSSNSSPTIVSRRNSSIYEAQQSSFTDKSSGRRAGFAIFEGTKTFGKQKAMANGDSIRYSLNDAQQAAASMHYTENDKYLAVVLSPSTQRFKVKRKDFWQVSLEAFSSLSASTVASLASDTSSSTMEDLRNMHFWFKEHRNVQPLMQLDFDRTRLVGLSNSASKGLWVNLDTDVRWGNFSADDLGDTGLNQLRQNTFPHAILQVRWEGQPSPQVIQTLDQGHLAERIPGFSIEAHAVASSMPDMPTPSWVSMLEKDIRRAPPPLKPDLPRRLSDRRALDSSAGNTTSTTDGQPSELFTAAEQSSLTSMTDSPTAAEGSASEPKRQKRGRKKRSEDTIRPQPNKLNSARYWNEFDDEEEQANNEPYTILINPDEGNVFSNMWSGLTSKTRALLSRLPLSFQHPEKHSRQDPLLRAERSLTASDADSDSPLSSPRRINPRAPKRSYSTFLSRGRRRPKPGDRAAASRDKLLFRLTLATFFLSLLFFVMSAVLEATGRRRYTAETNAIAILGIVASVILAILGYGFTSARDTAHADKISQASAAVAMVIACTANALLVLVMVRGMG